LVLIKAIDVLPAIFEMVYIPPSVIAELSRPKSPEAVRRWTRTPPEWLHIRAPAIRLPSTVRLGDGEADALSLAKELQINDVLIDERRGRNVARREGLTPLPTLAVLERAASDGLLDLPSTFEKLQQTNMRIPFGQIQAALARDAARKRH
jgi:predicted nucleic acid-binding protein